MVLVVAAAVVGTTTETEFTVNGSVDSVGGPARQALVTLAAAPASLAMGTPVHSEGLPDTALTQLAVAAAVVRGWAVRCSSAIVTSPFVTAFSMGTPSPREPAGSVEAYDLGRMERLMVVGSLSIWTAH